MKLAALPDLAASMALRRQTADLRAETRTAAEELSSGKRSDLFAASGRDPARLFAIDRARVEADRRIEGLKLAGGRAEAVQTSLEQLERHADSIGVDLEAALARGDMTSARLEARVAEGALSQSVATLNGRWGGRALFAGAATDGDALAPAADILSDVRALVNAAPDGAAAVADVEAYFGPGGGFETNRWLGDAAPASAPNLGDGATASPPPKADDDDFRRLLTGLTLAAVATEPGFTGDLAMQTAVLEGAATAMVDARQDLVGARAEWGITEERIETSMGRAQGRRGALELARSEAVAVDPFEAATRYQALESGLETLFTVTGRLSRLSLNSFLR